MSSLGVSAGAEMPSRSRTSGDSGTDLADRGHTPPPAEIFAAVVVVPRRAGEVEQPPALGPGDGRVRVRVEEHVAMVERRDQLQVRRQQHAVAEDVAGHVADPDNGERGEVGVDAEVAEVAPHALPRAAGRDAHHLVVVALAAA